MQNKWMWGRIEKITGRFFLTVFLLFGCKPASKDNGADPTQPTASQHTALNPPEAEHPPASVLVSSRTGAPSAENTEGESAKKDKGAYFIRQPILLGGYIAGDVQGGKYVPLDDKAVNDALAGTENALNGDGLIVDFVRLPEKMRLYGSRPKEVGIPADARIGTNCGGMPMLEFSWRDNGTPKYPAVLGMDATWNAVPRTPVELKDKMSWNEAVRALLRSEGKPNASPQIQSVQQIDLLKDGKPDIVVFAAQTKWKGRCAKNPQANGCRAGGEFDAARSYGLVAVAMDGVGPLKELLFYFSGELIWELYDQIFADVDGDGLLEFVFKISYYEGWRAGVIRIEPERTTEVLSMDCML